MHRRLRIRRYIGGGAAATMFVSASSSTSKLLLSHDLPTPTRKVKSFAHHLQSTALFDS